MTHLYPLTQPTKKETKKKKIVFLPSSGGCWLKPAEDSLIWADSMRKFEATVTDFYNLRKKRKRKMEKRVPNPKNRESLLLPPFSTTKHHNILLSSSSSLPLLLNPEISPCREDFIFFTDLSSQENNLKFLQTKPSWEDLFTTFSSTKTTFTAQY